MTVSQSLGLKCQIRDQNSAINNAKSPSLLTQPSSTVILLTGTLQVCPVLARSWSGNKKKKRRRTPKKPFWGAYNTYHFAFDLDSGLQNVLLRVWPASVGGIGRRRSSDLSLDVISLGAPIFSRNPQQDSYSSSTSDVHPNDKTLRRNSDRAKAA